MRIDLQERCGRLAFANTYTDDLVPEVGSSNVNIGDRFITLNRSLASISQTPLILKQLLATDFIRANPYGRFDDMGPYMNLNPKQDNWIDTVITTINQNAGSETFNISVNGFTEVGVEVELFKNEVSIGKTQVTESGDFVFKNIPLDDGDNSFSALAISKEAGSSDGSVPIVVSFDNKAPDLKITNPTESELTIDYADFDIIGESEKDTSVTINGKVAVVDDDGKFKLKFQLNMGKNELEVISRDLAGNETKKKITITYSL
jgi:hypothetical protein